MPKSGHLGGPGGRGRRFLSRRYLSRVTVVSAIESNVRRVLALQDMVSTVMRRYETLSIYRLDKEDELFPVINRSIAPSVVIMRIGKPTSNDMTPFHRNCRSRYRNNEQQNIAGTSRFRAQTEA